MLLVDVTSGDTLLSHDAGKLFMPASNQKLLTAAVAMQQLGPDFRWHTPVLLRGWQHGNRWIGDLLVAGSGDPSISDAMQSDTASRAFDPIVRALKGRGISQLIGDVVAIGDAFPGATSGFGWEMDDADESYGAPVDELLYNEGFVTVRVYGGLKAGAPVRVVRAPTTTYPPIALHVTTMDSVARRDRVRAAYDSVGSALELTGSVAVNDSAVLTVSYRHPNDAFRAALRERLVANGISVARPASLSRTARRALTPDATGNTAADTLLVLESPPLRELLPRMQKPSQNQIAELLFRSSGVRASGDGSADSARAVAARTLAAFGVAPDELVYRDGSGMSRHDYVTPRALVTVLDAMRRAPTFLLFRDALPIAGVDGNLASRMKGTPAAGNVHAKTGTVDKARSLSGYVTTADGHLVLFSLLCNNFTVSSREVDRVAELLLNATAAFRADGRSNATSR
jgi:D-alanyl-D-alanine carboxypeptidase/D-alanyl-D-alanine-endopeptidase (penicillin-binding protein 4)